MAAMDGYIRVSRTVGRKGGSYISPKVQRDKITGWAKLQDVELGEVVAEEDVSGAKPVDERELGRLFRRVESGESQGIIAYKLSRFGRGRLRRCRLSSGSRRWPPEPLAAPSRPSRLGSR